MKDAFLAALAAAVLWAALTLAAGGPESPAPTEPAPTEPAPTDTTALVESAAPAAEFDCRFSLPVLVDGSVQSMALDEYLTGVVLAELPASFEPEAMKAQAVACRTYALRRYASRKHDPAAVCTDSHCCMGWKDPKSADPAAAEKAAAAVRATDGLVLEYGDKLIDATFFSCSGGRTEAAVAVWGSDLPYLQSVDSPGEEQAAHFTDETRVDLETFRQTLQAEDPETDLSGDPAGWIGAETRTAGGGVDTLVLGGRSFAGTRLRSLFGLRSTDFTLTLTGSEAVFTTRGFGHRVGMSQYGAQAMAQRGSDFREILEWYYTGVEIVRYSG